MLSLMDGLSGRGEIIVIGATNRQNSIDPALRRPGRFDREIEIPVPTTEARKIILEIQTRYMPLDDNVCLETIVHRTKGFVGADLASLVKEAGMSAIRRIFPKITWGESIPIDLINSEWEAVAKVVVLEVTNTSDNTTGRYQVLKIYTGKEKEMLTRYWRETVQIMKGKKITDFSSVKSS